MVFVLTNKQACCIALKYRCSINKSDHIRSIYVETTTHTIMLETLCRLRATPHTRLRACDHYTPSTIIGGKVELVQVRFTLCLRDQWSMWMQDGCKVYMDSYMARNGSCFMVTWTIFKNHLLEVGLTQNWETLALRTLTTIGLFYFYHVWGPAWIEIHWNSIWLRAQSHMTSHYTWGSVTTLHDFGGVLGRPLDTFLWALTSIWSRLLALVWSAPNMGGGFVALK